VAWTADHRGSTPPKSFFESLPRELEEAGTTSAVISANIQAVAMILAIISILLVYPFVQRHFVSGVMLGSVKGVTAVADSRAAVRRWPSCAARLGSTMAELTGRGPHPSGVMGPGPDSPARRPQLAAKTPRTSAGLIPAGVIGLAIVSQGIALRRIDGNSTN
jgi:hypothetical protein